jgi:hypothetical protein
MRDLNLNTPHVIFLNAKGQVHFAPESEKFHLGLELIHRVSNFYLAVEFMGRSKVVVRDKIPVIYIESVHGPINHETVLDFDRLQQAVDFCKGY